MVDTLNIAKEAISFGFRPMPVNGKIPLIKDWNEKSKNDLYAQCEALIHAGKNVGIVCGQASKVIVLDVDTQHNGMNNYQQLLNEYNEGQELDTCMSITGSGGRHIFFEYEADLAIKNGTNVIKKFGANNGFDIRSDGGFIVYPGSVYHGCGDKPESHTKKGCSGTCNDDCDFKDRVYEWVTSPAERKPMKMPNWLVEMIVNKPIKPAQQSDNKSDSDENKKLYKINKEIIDEWVMRLSTNRATDYTMWINTVWLIRELGCDKSIAHEFSKKCPEKYSEQNVDQIWNQYDPAKSKYSINTLRGWLKKDLSDKEYKELILQGKQIVYSENEVLLYDRDEGLSTIFANKRKDNVKITDDNGNGYVWDAKTKLWQEKSANHIINLISPELKQDVDALLTRIKNENKSLDDEEKIPIMALIAIRGYVLGYQGSKNIHKKLISKLYDDSFITKINSVPYELPIKDGKVIDLRSGKVRERTINDYYKFECPVSYIMNANFVDVEKFYLDICDGDKDLLKFKQKMFGYMLTGETDARCVFIAWGKGKNGKSTVWDTVLKQILGCFWVACGQDVFFQSRRNGGATPELIPLIGARVAIMSESEEQQKLQSSRIKRLTGNDTMDARPLYREKITFTPVCKCVILTNEKPDFDINDQAMIDRVRFIPYKHRFENSNTQSVNEFIQKNIDLFFSWFVEGAIQYYKDRKLDKTQVEMTEMKEYIYEQDSVSQYLDECCERKKDAWVNSTELYNGYRDYCDNSRVENPVTKKKFITQIEKEFGKSQRKRLNGKQNNCYSGLIIPKERTSLINRNNILMDSKDDA